MLAGHATHRQPLQVPTFLVKDRTALSGYIQNFIMGVLIAGLSCTHHTPNFKRADTDIHLHRLAPSILPGLQRRRTYRLRRRQLWSLLQYQPDMYHHGYHGAEVGQVQAADVVRVVYYDPRYWSAQLPRRRR